MRVTNRINLIRLNFNIRAEINRLDFCMVRICRIELDDDYRIEILVHVIVFIKSLTWIVILIRVSAAELDCEVDSKANFDLNLAFKCILVP